MRLTEWAKRAPHKESMAPKVLAALKPVLTGLGAKPDPSCWVAWGDDPAARYTVLVAWEPVDASEVAPFIGTVGEIDHTDTSPESSRFYRLVRP